ALPATWPARVKVALVTALLWGGFVSLMTLVAYTDLIRTGRQEGFLEVAWTYVAGFFPWLFLGPLNFLIAYRLGTQPLLPRILLIAALGASAASLVLIFAYIAGVYAPLHSMGTMQVLQQLRLVDFVWDGVLFLTIFLSGVVMGNHQPSSPSRFKRVAIRSAGRVDYIDLDDVLAISARSNYVELFCTERSHLYRSTLKEFVEGCTDGSFVRIHRSHYVRPEAVTSIQANGGQTRKVILSNGTCLPIAKGYWDGISEKFAVLS
ncbi:MAG: LytTR family DNA-binding domain-containing protein, partial [Pseudomonadota bacterium]